MTRLHTFLATSLLCVGVAACGDSSLLAPEAPRFDGGSTFGSGNRAASDTSATERGGFGFGSGNSIVGTNEEPTTGRGNHTVGSGSRTEMTDTGERGGFTIGSGGRTDGTTTSATATTSSGDTTERGGSTAGSGNRTETTTATSTTTERGGHTISSNN